MEGFMIRREDILSINFLKKTEYTGCHQGMRYRLESSNIEAALKEKEEAVESGFSLPEGIDLCEGMGSLLRVTVWPEPFNYIVTPRERKQSAYFAFDEDGSILLETNADDDDIYYDEISSGLMVSEVRRKRQELFESLSLYYRVFILKEDASGLLES